MAKLSPAQRLNVAFVSVAAVAYLAVTFIAPKAGGSNHYHLSVVAIVFITVTILALWMLTCFSGLYAWLELDRYAQLLPKAVDREAYHQIANGVRLLAYSLLLSSILTAFAPFLSAYPGLATAVGQINYYIFILIAPFAGFMMLRLGTRKLSVLAQATLTLKAKVMTVAPPVFLLACFYAFLAATSAGPNTVLPTGPLWLVVLPLNLFLVVGAWVYGLLAALNTERATHRERPAASRPLVGLYNGILTVTGGFIILDALLSLGSARIASLPFGLAVILLYAFIAVICVGFMILAMSGKALIAATPKDK
jgi:hypothetical protein